MMFDNAMHLNITLQLQSPLAQLSLRFYLVSHLIRCLNSTFSSGIIVYVSSLVFVFLGLTQSKSVTDSIKELLSRKEMISSLSFLDVICSKKEMECQYMQVQYEKNIYIEHVELSFSSHIFILGVC